MAKDPKELTYDELTSMSRVEYASGELQPVRKDLYPAIRKIVEKSKKEFEKSMTMDSLSVLSDGASDSFKRMVNVVKDLIKFRTTKIMNMASLSARGATNVLDAMTPEEKELYEELAKSLKLHWEHIDVKEKSVIPDITEPNKVPEKIIEKPAAVYKSVENLADDKSAPAVKIPKPTIRPDTQPVPETSEGDEPEDDDEKKVVDQETKQPATVELKGDADDMVVIRVLEDVPSFSGLNNVVYNLKKEDIVRMPVLFANALVNRGIATQVDVNL